MNWPEIQVDRGTQEKDREKAAVYLQDTCRKKSARIVRH